MSRIFVFFYCLFVANIAFCAALSDNVHESPAYSKIDTKKQEIPYKHDEQVTSSLVMRVALSFILVISMAAGAIYLLKRYVPDWRVIGADKARRIAVIEVKRLSPKTSLFLVDVDGKTLLLAQSNDQLSTLAVTENKTSKLNQPAQDE